MTQKQFLSLTLFAFFGLLSAAPKGGALDFYFLDVEEGSATLIVTPAGRAIMIDGGNPGEGNLNRFLKAAKEAGVKKLDYLIVTHYHGDHYGVTPEISHN